MYLNSFETVKADLLKHWRITLDVFKFFGTYSLFDTLTHWRITLDVFKLVLIKIPLNNILDWRITLDVFKLVANANDTLKDQIEE